MMTLPRIRFSWAHPRRQKTFSRGAVAAVAALSFLSIAGTTLTVRPAVAQGSSSAVQTPMAVLWKYNGLGYSNNPAAPIYADGTIYYASGKILYAVDARQGALKWRFPADSASTLSEAVIAAPVIAGDTLYVGALDGLYAFDAAAGTKKWYINIPGGVTNSPVVVGKTVFAAGQNNRLYAANTATGDFIPGVWSMKGKEGVDMGGDVIAGMTAADGYLYYVTGNQVLHKVDLSSGVQRYANRVEGDIRAALPAVTGETFYLITGSTLSKYRTNGVRLWPLRLPNDAVAPPATDAAGNVYVVTADRYVYAINPSGGSLWRKSVRVDEEVLTAPVVVDNLLIVATALGGVNAFDTATGALKWSYILTPSGTNASYLPTVTNVAATPLVADGSLYILSDDGSLTAFRHDAPDSQPPTITQMVPEPGDALNGRPPFHISARVGDVGSGIDISSLHVKLDGKDLPRRIQGVDAGDKEGFSWDPNDGSVEYYTQESGAGRGSSLVDGHHSVSISVKDWMGNLATKTWSFVIDDTVPRRAMKRANSANGGSKSGTKGGSRGPGGAGATPGGPGGGE